MNVSLLFWLGLALPGYVLVRRLASAELESGLLGTLSLSYLGTLALLSPASILCYLVGAPLWAFSCFCVALFVLAVLEISRRRWWRGLGGLIVAAASIEVLILVADLVLGARVGAFMEGDARVHLARIRFLVDNGFSNLDPYVATNYFFPTYHTNILHALHASCVQLTGVDHFGVWFASLMWGKVLAASGMYYLAWCIFGRRWAAWVAAMCVVGAQGPVIFIVYPNKLAPLWVLPCMLGFMIQALAGRCTWASCVRLGLGSLVLGQIHGLYAGFAALLLMPVIGAVGVYRLARRAPDRWRLGACALALAAGLPFPLISSITSVSSSGGDNATLSTEDSDKPLAPVDDGRVMKDLRRAVGARPWRFVLLGLGLTCALSTRRRREVVCLAASVVIAAVVLYVPPVRAAAVELLGQTWIVGRLGIALQIALVALLAPTVAYWLEPRVRPMWARGLISTAAVALAVFYTGHKAPYDWGTYARRAFAAPEERLAKIDSYRVVRGTLVENLPAGATVLADIELGMWLVTFYDCRIIAAASSNNGVEDLAQRRKDLESLLAQDTPWSLRRHLLQQYDVRYFAPMTEASAWARPYSKRWWRWGIGAMVELDIGEEAR